MKERARADFRGKRAREGPRRTAMDELSRLRVWKILVRREVYSS